MRHTIFATFTKTLVCAVLIAAMTTAHAQTKEVEVGLIAPMSGPWARQGQVMTLAADMAIKAINE